MTMPTSCPCSQWLFQHVSTLSMTSLAHVHLVNDYGVMQFFSFSKVPSCWIRWHVLCSPWLCWHVSTKLMTNLTWCRRSCWLRWHGAMEGIQWLCRHSVSVLNDHADIVLAWSMTTLTLCQHSQGLHGYTFFANFHNIFVKTKKFMEPF